MKRNLTIQLDEDTIKRARVIAARRATSISRLVREAVKKAAEEDTSWETAKKIALQQLNNPFHLGGSKLPSRKSLYDR
jgi:predicted transcriptional regulator